MNDASTGFWIIVAVVVLLFVTVDVVAFLMFFPPWFRAVRSRAQIPLPAIVSMRLRGRPVRVLVDAYLLLKSKDTAITIAEVEEAYDQNSDRMLTADRLADLITSERKTEAS